MVSGRVLVTTALEETWPQDGQPVVFLGEWCRLHGRRRRWEPMDAEVARYHWDDRARLEQDFRYLQEVHARLLPMLAAQLNALHGVDHGERYWRILVGPWLGQFLQILFDRWTMLKVAVRDHAVAQVRLVQRGAGPAAPRDMQEFNQAVCSDDWNERLYGQILQACALVPEILPVTSAAAVQQAAATARTQAGGRLLVRAVLRLEGWLGRHDRYFFLSTGLGIRQSLQLQLRLGQLPKLWRSPALVLPQARSRDREWCLAADTLDPFVALAARLVPGHIPVAYLEGYSALCAQVQRLPWPRRPEVIFTSSAYNSDEAFKAWAGEKVSGGSRLVVGQHGGNYGTARWSFFEQHEQAIADRYLTWGWDAGPRGRAVGNFKQFSSPFPPARSGSALMVQMALPRYSYHMYSVPVAAGQWAGYFQDQCRFIAALPERIRRETVVRLFPTDWEYRQRERWTERFPGLTLDTGSMPLARQMAGARVYISTYNATTFLESMGINFPTIIFWNPLHWELRDAAKPHFHLLEEVGIFHQTPEGAARYLAEIWEDVNAWWNGERVQSARARFCALYSDTRAETFGRLAAALEEARRLPGSSTDDEGGMTCE